MHKSSLRTPLSERPPRWLLLLLLLTAACTSEQIDAGQQAAASVEAVVGGEPVEACQWPSTVSINGWGSCSGTLIHPRVVTTAAHCLSGSQATVYFGAGRGAPGAFSLTARCRAGAQGTRAGGTSKDWGYCVLPDDDRVKQIPITPPLVGCEADRYLKAGALAWVVGYGTTSALGQGAGIKRQVQVKINGVDKPSDGVIDVGDADAGACHGDSGGPLYMHVGDDAHDWGYRVVGSTSSAGMSRCDCNCSTVYVNIANHVREIERNEDIDVTPCTDADGNWDPSEACNQLIAAPAEGGGAFPACSVARTREPIDSCGMGAALLGSSGQGAAAGGGGSGPAAGAGGQTPLVGAWLGFVGQGGGAPGAVPDSDGPQNLVEPLPPRGGADAVSALGSLTEGLSAQPGTDAQAGAPLAGTGVVPGPVATGCQCSASGARGRSSSTLALLACSALVWLATRRYQRRARARRAWARPA